MTSLRTIAMLGLGLAMYHGCAYCQRVDPALVIDPDLNFSVVLSPERSELQEFAMSFHQDWDLVFPDFLEGAAMLLKGLSPERRALLRSQFDQFLRENENASSEELKKKWFGLGAEAWQPGLEVRSGLREMLVLM